jgi:hypothetical protein
MKMDDFEKKMYISGLGIIILTLIFYVIHQKSKLREPGMVVGTAMSIMPEPWPSSFTDLFMSIGQLSISIGAKVQAATAAIASRLQASAIAAKNIATQRGIHVLTKIADKAKDASDKARGVASQAKTAIRAEKIAQKQKINARITAIKQNIQIEIQRLKAEFEEKKKSMFTFKKFFKYGLLLVMLSSKIGRWVIKTTSIILMRISNLKSCFLWYALEIIGWILYIPMEFIVWFFCIQSIEDNFWGLVKEADCFIHGVMGFHVFYYSEHIRKKCFIPRLPPFPSVGMGGLFTKKGFAKILRDMFLPPDPRETAKYVEVGLIKYKKTLMEGFKKPPNFDIDEIWKEAFSMVKLLNPMDVPKDGSENIDDGDAELTTIDK